MTIRIANTYYCSQHSAMPILNVASYHSLLKTTTADRSYYDGYGTVITSSVTKVGCCTRLNCLLEKLTTDVAADRDFGVVEWFRRSKAWARIAIV